MANKAEQVAYEIGDVLSAQQGVFLVHAEFKKENKEYFLRLYIDKEGGVGIDDCEKFSREFSQRIDAVDPIEEAYTLEVSSPGVDRRLTTEREFCHYIGREVEAKLYAAKDGKKELCGILESFNDGIATISSDGVRYDIAPKDAVYIRLSFKF